MCRWTLTLGLEESRWKLWSFKIWSLRQLTATVADGKAEVSFQLPQYLNVCMCSCPSESLFHHEALTIQSPFFVPSSGEWKYNGQRWTSLYYFAADLTWRSSAQYCPAQLASGLGAHSYCNPVDCCHRYFYVYLKIYTYVNMNKK